MSSPIFDSPRPGGGHTSKGSASRNSISDFAFRPGGKVPTQGQPTSPASVPSSATPGGMGPVNNALAAARALPNLWPNSGTLAGSAADAVDGWRELGPFDRPMLLIPLTQPVVGLLYWPGKRPPTDAQALRSHAGVVYMAGGGGPWWIAYRDPTAGSTLNYLIVDASDPAVSSRYLGEAGTNTVSTQADFTVPVSVGVAIVVAAANRYRTALLIQNLVAQGTRIGLGFVPTGGTPPAGVGIQLINATASLSLGGDTVYKGDVYAISNSASVAGAISVTEWT